MAKYIVTSDCEAQIFEIVDHIAANDIHASVAFYKRLKEVFKLISENPRIGRERNELSDGLRSFPVVDYVIFYRMWTSDVAITRAIHGARDIEELFDHDLATWRIV